MSTEQVILDKWNGGEVYGFIPAPVWFSVRLELPHGTQERTQQVIENHQRLQNYLRECYEAARAGVPPPDMSPEVKEILWPELQEAKSAKPPKKRATAADSNTGSPKT